MVVKSRSAFYIPVFQVVIIALEALKMHFNNYIYKSTTENSHYLYDWTTKFEIMFNDSNITMHLHLVLGS